MKITRIALTLLLAALASLAHSFGVPNELYILQTLPSGSGAWQRYFAPLSPTPNTSGVLMYDGATTLPQMGYLGSGLNWDGTTLTASVPPFNFSLPSARTLAVSTDYQAVDPTKAAVIVPTYACTNATTVIAASACTVQVRMGSSALTCATGTVYYTQSLTVSLGVLITQASANPVPISLPIGAHFIICATAGTFTITTVEQTAG